MRCAVEISIALHDHTDIRLRMGIHTGPVHRVEDINAARNVSGSGINLAQRVMDCGDAGHILLSATVADTLRQVGPSWTPSLHDLGEAEVKHGVRVHIYSLYNGAAGNPALPHKLHASAAVVVGKKRKKISFAVIAAFHYSQRSHVLTDKDT